MAHGIIHVTHIGFPACNYNISLTPLQHTTPREHHDNMSQAVLRRLHHGARHVHTAQFSESTPFSSGLRAILLNSMSLALRSVHNGRLYALSSVRTASFRDS